MPIQLGDKKIANIFKGDTAIQKVFKGDTLVFDFAPADVYEELADVNVTTATTQIDFDNLNITKDDELKLVYTFVGATTTERDVSIFVNNNTTASDYTRQLILPLGSSIIANRSNTTDFSYIRSNQKSCGFMDIKVSNNDRFIGQNQNLDHIGSQSSSLRQANHNIVSTFTVSSITKISVSSPSNHIGVGSRLTLYKVVK
jgi:hypothetical protein